jgi:hypothetical protein
VAAILLLASVMFSTGCGGSPVQSSDDQDNPTITAQQAGQQAQSYANQLKTALPAQATLEDRGVTTSACPNPSGVGFENRVHANADYWVRGLNPGDYNEYFDTVKSWLPAHGWTVDTDQRPGMMFLSAYRTDDEFTVSLQANSKGGLALGTSSPCVWPNGIPEKAP